MHEGTNASGRSDEKTVAQFEAHWKKAVGITVSVTRKKFNLTQADLAAKARCSRNVIANLESGRRTARFFDLIRIARALNMAEETLILRVLHWGIELEPNANPTRPSGHSRHEL